MEFFEKARTVRLKGRHGKYLWADDDQYKVVQHREGKNQQALWRVEAVRDSKMVRLISCYNTYLTASDEPFLLGMTGKKVVQTRLKHVDSSVEWEPVKEGYTVKLKTIHGNFLRANNGPPPWRNSITHDLPQAFQRHMEYILWEVEDVSIPNIIPVETSPVADLRPQHREPHLAWVPHVSPKRAPSTPKPDEGRDIFYTVADETGEVKGVDDKDGWSTLKFKGHSLKLLQERLQAETGLEDDIILCSRHPVSNKLFTLRLGLPPNNAPMHIIVVRESSSLARTLSQVPIQAKEVALTSDRVTTPNW